MNKELKNYDHVLWRNSGLVAKLGLGIVAVDARVGVTILPLIFHIDMSSVYFFLGSVGLFAILEFMGYTIPVSIIKARSFFAGKKRYTQQTISNRRRMIHG